MTDSWSDLLISNKRAEEFRGNHARLQALQSTSTEIVPGHWQPARPVPSPYPWASFKQRLRGAWLVLVGKAQFIRWYR